jgi:HSP20 family protein
MSDTATIEKRVTTNDQPELTRGGKTYVPAVDIIERGDELLVHAEVPGATADGIDIQYERGQLTIVARANQRQGDKENYLLHEYGIGDFVRCFQVGDGIDASKISAELSQGILTLRLPKAERSKAHQIKVRNA